MSGARPFLKWIGGKRGLLPIILPHFPQKIATYHEPFVGAGAVFFALENLASNNSMFGLSVGGWRLSDSNDELISTYKALRADAVQVMALLQGYRSKHSEAFFLEMRDCQCADIYQVAARMIYLNKAAFNGKYALNSKGRFVAGWGKRDKPLFYCPDNLLRVQTALRKATISVCGFAKTQPGRGDLVYCDPPYDGTYDPYNKDKFGATNQAVLAQSACDWADAGATVILSNADTPLIRELYPEDRWQVMEVASPRHFNTDSDRKVGELLISSAV